MSPSVEYRQLAMKHRLLAQQEGLPNVRAILAASAEKWEFLADVTASEEQTGLRAITAQQVAAPERLARPRCDSACMTGVATLTLNPTLDLVLRSRSHLSHAQDAWTP